MVDLPRNLLDSMRNRNCILFLGAGASRDALSPDGGQIPDGNALRTLISNRFLGGKLTDRPLAEVCEYAVSETDLPTFQRFIRDVLIPFKAAAHHKIIPLFPWRAIFTTNLDLVIEDAYLAEKTRVQNLVPFLRNSQRIDQELRAVANSLEFVKLHGHCESYLDLEIPFILATEQYANYSHNRTRLFSRLSDLAEEYNLIFCGYSVLDAHIQSVLYQKFSLGAVRPAYFIVKPHFDEVESRYWSGKRVTPISATFQEFLVSLRDQLNPALVVAGARAAGDGHPVRRFYRRTNITETPDLSKVPSGMWLEFGVA